MELLLFHLDATVDILMAKSLPGHNDRTPQSKFYMPDCRRSMIGCMAEKSL
jgi:hypothetical protein